MAIATFLAKLCFTKIWKHTSQVCAKKEAALALFYSLPANDSTLFTLAKALPGKITFYPIRSREGDILTVYCEGCHIF